MLKKKAGSAEKSPWWWVPSLYYVEGIPYIIVMMVSVIFYKRMGVSNSDIALYTSWLYLPWVIKPLWSPVVDIFRTKRFWIVTMQLIIGAGLGGVALSIPLPNFFKITLGFFWLLAFSSATHDIAADGFYMLGLSKHQQAWFVGVRSTFYRFAMITGQGLLIILAGYIESHSGLPSINLPVKAVENSLMQSQMAENKGYNQNDLIIIAIPDTLEIPIKTISRTEADSLINHVKAWNLKTGHITKEESSRSQGKEESDGLWKKIVVKPLESFLRKYFSERKSSVSGDFTGNLGKIEFTLSAPPEKEVVVHFGRESGDKSISLITGERFVFDRDNWNQPAIALIQIDHRLKYETAAYFEARAGNIPLAWLITFAFTGILIFLFHVYHRIVLPHPASDIPSTGGESGSFTKEFINTFILFFKKRKIGLALAFLLLYRLGESQLVKLASPFLLDSQEMGGLALSTGQVGFVYGTVGIIMLTLGGLLGGFLAARNGLKYWLWWMAIAINLPDAVYIYLSHFQPDDFLTINICVGIEQFGYGFGFTAYMLFMIYISEGKHKTAHFAITTGFMALGMMIPGMFSGWLQEIIGYQHFFIWVLIATIPGFIVIKFLDIDPEFGKKSENRDKVSEKVD